MGFNFYVRQIFMLKTKLLIFLIAGGCLIPLAARDPNLFITRVEVHNGEKLIAITGYNGTAKTVVIPSRINGIPVRKIADNAFKLKLLVEVTIPEGIEIIGAWAFSGNKLKTVKIPSSVRVIAPSAFDSNTLKQAEAGDKRPGSVIFFTENSGRYNPVTSGGGSRKSSAVVFITKTGMLAPAVPATNNSTQKTPDTPAGLGGGNVPDVGLDAGGTPVKLNSESGIGNSAYSSAGLSAISIPQEAKFIGDGAFAVNNLTAVVIPPAVRRIGRQAFMGNPLVSITIGEKVLVQYDSFRYQFSDYYRMNDYKAGTYILKAGHWNFEGQEPAPKFVNR
jgi:hypothetical protein